MSVNINELRLHNLCYLHGEIHEILPGDFVYLYGEEDTDFGDMYSPIPLDKDILIKCGFIQKGDWFYLRDFVLGFITTEDVFQTEIKCAGIIRENPWRLLNISSLHQLQNLYFALAGDELNIDLTK